MAGSVLVLGGGVAGLSVAHELVERGFDVQVLELRDVPGGKARSVLVSSTIPRQNVGTVHLGRRAGATRRDLPGEHGFRFFPRFYKHIVDTMARIPYRSGRSVADNLVDTTGTLFTRFDKSPLRLPTITPHTVPELFSLLGDLQAFFGRDVGIAPEEYSFFGERIWQILTSSGERRLQEYEKIGWWEFIGADERSEAYQKLLGIGCTRSVVAAQAKRASTKTIGDMFVQYFFNLAEPGISADRVLNGPTNDVWIDPWVDYLRARGVEYHLNATVRSIDCSEHGMIESVTVQHDRKIFQMRADYYVAALPVEVMARLITDVIVRADPGLAHIFALSQDTAWMNGIQFYLSDDVPIGRGHQLHVDSPWALTSISQRQFWSDVDVSRFGAGDIRGIISVVISDWETPGLNGKAARDCSRHELRDEVWEQLKRSINVPGWQEAGPTFGLDGLNRLQPTSPFQSILRDDAVKMWYLDLAVDPLTRRDAEPLLVNLVDTWRLRPQAVTAIPNFFLAADYIQTTTDLACMEGANEAARLAVNGIIRRADAQVPLCRTWNLHEPELLEPWRAHDRARFRQGLPWDDSFMRVALDALAALQRGTTLLEATIHDAVSSAMHIEDLASYLRTGESRSSLVNRLMSGGSGSASEVLRAFAAMAQSPAFQRARADGAAALDSLTVAGQDLGNDIQFVDR